MRSLSQLHKGTQNTNYDIYIVFSVLECCVLEGTLKNFTVKHHVQDMFDLLCNDYVTFSNACTMQWGLLVGPRLQT